MRFLRWVGIRHIQVAMLAILIFLDVYQLEAMRLYIYDSNEFGLTRTFQRVVRSFGEPKLRQLEQLNFAALFIGRLISPSIVLRLNNKYLLICIALVEVLTSTLLTHVVVIYGFYAFLIMTTVMMFLQSLHWPVAINILAKWITPQEYTRAVVAIAAGDTIARSIIRWSIATSRYRLLAVVFHVSIALKLIWCIAFMFVGAQDPQTSFLIREPEWALLSKEIGPRKKVNWKRKIPWKGILTCPRLYALMITEIAVKWFFVMTADIRSYCPDLNVDDCEIAMMFHPVLAFGTAWLLDHLITKYYISRNNARKIISTIAMWGSAFSIAFMCYNYKKPEYVEIYLITAQYLFLLIDCSQTSSIFDISPNYAVVIFCVYMVPAWGSLVLRGWMDDPYIGENSSLKKSLPVFMRAGLLLFVFNYGFLMIGNIKILNFDAYDTYDWRKESVISYP